MLADLFGSKLRAKVLGWFYTHCEERFYVRQVQSILREDVSNLSRELARLAALGVLTCFKEGQEKYYQANKACSVFTELRGLASKTFGLADIIRGLLEPLHKDIRWAFIYGSQAKATASASSDIDLFIIGRARLGEIIKAIAPAGNITGREVNASVFAEGEFKTKVRDGQHFVTSVLRDPKIILIGDEDELADLAQESVAR